ncbi:MAG: response regulator [Methylocystaceae bacterium]|nr:response regulator [Methylocystaceae bacterium]
MGISLEGCLLEHILAIPHDYEWLKQVAFLKREDETYLLLRKGNGSTFMAEIAITPSPDEEDARILWVNEARSLQKANQSLKVIFDNAPQALLVCHPRTAKIMRINKSAADFFGLDLEMRNNWGILDDIIKPSTRKAIFYQVNKERQVDGIRIMVYNSHKSKIPVSLSARFLDIGAGQCILIGLTTGLGKLAHQTVETHNETVAFEMAEPIINATPFALMAITLENGRLTQLNLPASRLLRVSRRDIINTPTTLEQFVGKKQALSLLDQIKLQGEVKEHPVQITPNRREAFDGFISGKRAHLDGHDYAVFGLSKTQAPKTAGYEEFFDQAPIPMLLIDKSDKARVKRLNRRAHELFIADGNSDIETLRLKNILGLRTYSNFRKNLETSGFVDDFEVDLETAYGETISCLLSGHTIHANADELFLVSINDITERKESALTLERFFNAAPLPMILSSLETGKVKRINRRASELFATPVDVERATLTLKDFFGQNETENFFSKVKNGGFVDDFEVIIETPYGEKIWGLLSGQLINIEGEDCIMTGINDITERKHVEVALKKSREEALEATRQKSSFLSTMSHEIRTPMTGVLGMLELLHLSNLDEEQSSSVAVVKDSATALLTIIDDILDFSKIEAGRLKLEHIVFDIREVIESAVELMGARARAKELELICTIAPDVPENVIGDPTRLRQILLNLIGNAIKFTATGAISVRVLSLLNSKNTAFLRFEVQDEGIGISQEKLRLLFKPFSQTDSSTSRHFGGTGLGLSICKALTELMKGQISVISEEDKGSTFWFELGLETAEVEKQEKTRNMLQDKSILVLQNHPETLKSYTQTLEQEGAVVWAGTCLEEVKKNGQTEHLDLAIIDHALQGFDGFETIKQLQKEINLPSSSIILTSSTFADQVMQEARDLGLGGRIFKPVRQMSLIRQACQACGVESGIQARRKIEPRAQMKRSQALSENKLVLFAEDNPTNQLVIGKQLARLGYAYDIAENGVVALEKLAETNYALLLSDCRMPEMNGLELSLTIRKQELQNKVDTALPIIALTANATAEDADACYSAGMNDYLVKPLKFEKLGEAMHKWLPLEHEEGDQKKDTPHPTSDQPPSTTMDAPAVDLSQLGEILGMDDPEMFDEILNFFVETMEELMGDLESAIQSGDAQNISDKAHAAKGASRNAAAVDLANTLEFLEKNAFTMTENDIRKTQQNILQNVDNVKKYVSELRN